jgi:hypothetical protein
MMTREDRQEALSLAYVHAVVAAAGMTHARPVMDYGIDLTLNDIAERQSRRYESGAALSVQLKSTTTAIATRTTVAYDLSKKAYDDLRDTLGTARILVLCIFPNIETEWVRVTAKKLDLRGLCILAVTRGATRSQESLVRSRDHTAATTLLPPPGCAE